MAFSNLKEIELTEVLNELPNITPFDLDTYCQNKSDDLFITTLGFEDRCLAFSEIFAKDRIYKATKSIYFTYETNSEDNDINRPRLIKALNTISGHVNEITCNWTNFNNELRSALDEISECNILPKITFDISVCSSQLLISTLTTLFEYNIKLNILYAEAGIYHPTEEEYHSNPGKWTSDNELGVTRGVGAVTPSPDHPGWRVDNLPEAVIAFATFKPERMKAIITNIDPSLLLKPDNRLFWVIGKPHLKEDWWRANVQKEINKLNDNDIVTDICTFDYKLTLSNLENIYHRIGSNYHINIAALGSKMQSLGIAIYHLIRPDISIYYATPQEYNAVQYSDEFKNLWVIQLGDIVTFKKLLDNIGLLTEC